MGKLRKYIRNVLVSIDQLINTVLGGDPDETLSSRAYKLDKHNNITTPRKIIDKILGSKHCEQHVEQDEGKNAIVVYEKENK
jgi:hypothetical protein